MGTKLEADAQCSDRYLFCSFCYTFCHTCFIVICLFRLAEEEMESDELIGPVPVASAAEATNTSEAERFEEVGDIVKECQGSGAAEWVTILTTVVSAMHSARLAEF